jgi:ABC-type multidrug transport system fused ATPase/permease subunit
VSTFCPCHTGAELTGVSRGTLDESVAGRFCRILLIEGAVFFALCMALEARLVQRVAERLRSRVRLLLGARPEQGDAAAEPPAEQELQELQERLSSGEGEDEDVAAERRRVLKQHPAEEGADPLLVRNLRKRYPGRGGAPPKLAVRDVCFGVGRGECFGLLGVNGAGKSTIMSILTGDALPTLGSASIGACDIGTERERVRQLIGCESPASPASPVSPLPAHTCCVRRPALTNSTDRPFSHCCRGAACTQTVRSSTRCLGA